MPVKPGGTRQLITPEELERLRELHAEGRGRNEIARIMDRPLSTVTLMARRCDLRFTGQRYEAMEKLSELAAEKRAELALKFLDDADAIRAQLWDTTTLINFGGRDNTVATHEVDQPPARDKQYLAMAASALVDRSLKLSEADRGSGADHGRSLIGQLAKGLQALSEAMDQEEGAGDEQAS